MNNTEPVLSQLSPGQSAAVAGLTADGPMRRRLQDIGLIEGTRVLCLRRSPFGDPTAYAIRGAVIALRREDARTVRISSPGEEDLPWD